MARRPKCICDWPSDCGGTGVRTCQGCGGDFCVCAACHGQGEGDCREIWGGCSECEDDDGYCDGMGGDDDGM